MLLIAITLSLPRLVTGIISRNRIYSIDDSPNRSLAVVFGAGLRRDGTPTPVLVDRINAAARLYKAGKVDMLLMSGFQNHAGFSEPEAMRNAAIALGLPADKILLDEIGKRTFDTCRRIIAISGVKNVILVSQEYHLPRAIFTSRHFGVDAIGVSADLRSYRLLSKATWQLRELAATIDMFWDILMDQSR